MRTFNFQNIHNWLLNINLNSNDPVDKEMAGEALDLIKEQRKWLNRSLDIRAVYTDAYDRGKHDALNGTNLYENGDLTGGPSRR